jgi:hypothetical protein
MWQNWPESAGVGSHGPIGFAAPLVKEVNMTVPRHA